MASERLSRRNDEEIQLSELPIDNIRPVNIAENAQVTISISPRDIDERFNNWIQTIVNRTHSTNKEYGFYVDRIGNIIGVVDGQENEIHWPNDYTGHRWLKFHTHPRLRFGPVSVPDCLASTIDIENMLNRDTFPCMSVVLSPSFSRGITSYSIQVMKFNQQPKPPSDVNERRDSLSDKILSHIKTMRTHTFGPMHKIKEEEKNSVDSYISKNFDSVVNKLAVNTREKDVDIKFAMIEAPWADIDDSI